MWLIIKQTELDSEIFTILRSDIADKYIKILIRDLQANPKLKFDNKPIGVGKFVALKVNNSADDLITQCSDLDHNSNAVIEFTEQIIKRIHNETIAKNLTSSLISKLKAKA